MQIALAKVKRCLKPRAESKEVASMDRADEELF